MSVITAKQASNILDVSEATIRNWVRHGYLKPIGSAKNQFKNTEVNTLKDKIERGEIGRLRKRANKKNSEHSFVPEEYLDKVTFIEEVERIRKVFAKNHLNIETTVFILALKQLTLFGEVKQWEALDVLKIEAYSDWKRSHVKNLMHAWSESLNLEKEALNEGYVKVYNILNDVSHADTLGIVYQSLLLEGNKSMQGAYYTPTKVVDAIFEEYHAENSDKFLDPCCGTGQFLLGAIRSGVYTPEMLYGYEIDDLAARIAQINLLLAFQETDFSPNVFTADTLKDIATGSLFCRTNSLRNSFQFIATNPPWGSSIDADKANDYGSLFPHITSGESFSYFLSKCIDLAKKNGVISLILPESILNIRTHADIRKCVLTHTTIKTIQCFGRIFKGVFTPVIQLDLINEKAPES